jgi:hypothetical protein
MLGMDLATALPLVKASLDKEGLKSIIVRLVPVSEENPSGVEVVRYTKDVIEHIQLQSKFIAQCNVAVETATNAIENNSIVIEGIKEILSSRKNAENKIKALDKLLAE